MRQRTNDIEANEWSNCMNGPSENKFKVDQQIFCKKQWPPGLYHLRRLAPVEQRLYVQLP